MTKAGLIGIAALGIFVVAPADAAPTARARVKVVLMDGKPPQITDAFLFGAKEDTPPVQFKRSDWSEWLPLPFPASGAPVTVSSIRPQRLPANVFPRLKLEVECTIEGSRETSRSEAELCGPQLGFILWQDSAATVSGISHIDTFAGHDRRVYGPEMKEAWIPAEQRPKKIVLGERFIGGDQDLIGWREGIGRLAGMGFNARPFFGRMHYLSEVFTLHIALLHSGFPVRFVDEQSLSGPDSLKDCRVLYASAPDLPAESVDGVLRWVADGRTLVTVAGTGLFDRYHQPAQMLARGSGIAVKTPLRPLVDEAHAASVAATTDAGELTALGPVEELMLADARPVAHFSNGAAAVTEKTFGKGRIIHFALFPGFSYVKGGNDAWRRMIVKPVHDAAVTPPATVSVTKIEAPVLYSEAGAVTTLLNWSGKEQEVELSVAVDKPVRQVESVLKGPLKFRADAGRAKLRVRLAEVDLILFRY